MANPNAKLPVIGDHAADGTIYAGISPDTGQALYVTRRDAPLSLRLNWQEAMGYAAALDAHGHKDWSLPTLAELKVLFNNRAKIGGFKEDSAYWSSTGYDMEDAWVQNDAFAHSFHSDGQGYTDDKNTSCNVRCVRRDQAFNHSVI